MKKFIFALIAMVTISFASCAGNTNNQEPTEETTETVIDSVWFDEPEDDTIVFIEDSTVVEEPDSLL